MNLGDVLHIHRFPGLQDMTYEKFVKDWLAHFSHMVIEEPEVVLLPHPTWPGSAMKQEKCPKCVELNGQICRKLTPQERQQRIAILFFVNWCLLDACVI